MSWGAFFILGPLDLVFLGAILWVPLLLWRERRRSVRYGFLPGVVWRFGTIAIIVTAGVLAPVKHEDRRVGPLFHTSVTIGDLVAAGVIYPLHHRGYDALPVSLPSRRPTRREVMRAISEQTGFRASIFHCGMGASLLFGAGGGLVRVDAPVIERSLTNR